MTEPDHARPTPPGTHHSKVMAIFYMSLAVIALAVFGISLSNPLLTAVRGFMSILSPIFIGAVIAYLCNPFLVFYQRRLFCRVRARALRMGLSLLLTILTAFFILFLVGLAIIPQLYRSLAAFAGNIDLYMENLQNWLEAFLDRLPFEVDLNRILNLGEDSSGDLLTDLLDRLSPLVTEGDLLDRVGRLLASLFNTFKNLFIGMFIAFYILSSKEKRIAQIRKARAALLSERADRRFMEIVTLSNDTFGGFLYGKLLDSLVIGILTFVMLTIFDISEYNLLIAVIVGITNVIPVFGPFIGAVPAFFIVLISNPSNALLVLILILIIQQLDGNIIGPKILGDNTGVSSLCVIVAISICSTLWGVVGMIVGVPIFAVVIELIRRMLEDRLTEKGLPTDTSDYYPSDAIGNPDAEVHYEHSRLRYYYEHSRFKARLDRARARKARKVCKATAPPDAEDTAVGNDTATPDTESPVDPPPAS